MQNTEIAESKGITATEEKFLSFQLGRNIFAVDILAVREIVAYDSITRIPRVNPVFHGVVNLRGNVVPVIDLAHRFGRESKEIDEHTCIIVVEIETDDAIQEVGMLVDSVNEVLSLAIEQIEPPPGFGASIRAEFISGMGKLNDNFIMLLAIDRVLNISELSTLEYDPVNHQRVKKLQTDNVPAESKALPQPHA